MASTFRRKSRAGSFSALDTAAGGGTTSSDESLLSGGGGGASAAADGIDSGSISRPAAAAEATSSSSAAGLLLPPAGCRAWTAGTVLTSTGLRELDNQLAATTGRHTGGQPLGTCVYVEEDRCLGSSLASCLVRYWCAEALSHEQSLLIPVAAASSCESCQTISSDDDLSSPSPLWGDSKHSDSKDAPSVASEKDVAALLNSLPRNLHKDKQQQQQQQQQHATGSNSLNQQLDSLAEEDEDEDEAEEGLVVAWQYRKEIQQERLGLSNDKTSNIVTKSISNNRSSSKSAGGKVYCHSYDLQGQLADQINVEQATTIVPMGCCCCCSSCCLPKSHSPQSCGFRYYGQLMEQVETMVKEQPRKVIRVLLYHPEPTCLAVALPLFLNHICDAKLPVVVLATVQPWTVPLSRQQSSLRHLQRTADVVLEVESFAGRQAYPPPSEFRHLHGLLRIRKATTCTLANSVGHFCHMTVQKRPVASLFGLKRDRRKLHLQLLHIPPEDYAADGGSVGSGAVRSGAGRPSARQATSGCSSSGGGALDF